MTTLFKKPKYIEFLYVCIEIWEKIYLDFKRLFLMYFETVGNFSFIIIYVAHKIVYYVVQSFFVTYK